LLPMAVGDELPESDEQIIIIIYVKNCSVYRNTVRVTLSLEI